VILAVVSGEGLGMRAWAHDRFRFPLPAGHRFPLDKYGMLRERVLEERILAPTAILEAEPVAWDRLLAVHDATLVARLRDGGLSLREERGLGLPWSAQLIERSRRAVGGTVAAAGRALERGIAMNFGGGTHHAGRTFARGYCVFNDVAVAAASVRATAGPLRILIVDCDVHQGDGTAQIFTDDPATFTLSLHGARNYPFQRIPSSLDVDLPSGTGDETYLRELNRALRSAFKRFGTPDLAFFLAGADPWEGDRLGRLSLTKEGLRARDALVLDRLGGRGVPVCVTLAGGYAPDVRDTVDINVATVRAVVARAHSG
jgi:acetoin utilization deacetylase AcuC-like enzyme